jgi:hypothetical protein
MFNPYISTQPKLQVCRYCGIKTANLNSLLDHQIDCEGRLTELRTRKQMNMCVEPAQTNPIDLNEAPQKAPKNGT